MNTKVFEGFRIQTKGDTEENLKKAINFTPLVRELITVLPNEEHKYVRFRLGDGETNVNNLPDINVQADWEQTDPTQPDYIKNKPDNFGGEGGLTEEEIKDIIADETEDLMPKPNTIVDRNYGDGSIPSQTENDQIKKYLVRGNIQKGDINGARYSIPLRNINGCIQTLKPQSDTDAANKEYVDDIAENKVDKYLGSDNNPGGNGFLYAVDANGNQIIEQYNHQLYGSSRGTIVKRFGMHILVPEDPETLGAPALMDKVATSKYYVDKGDKENSDIIAENTKRIENLESTLLTYIEDSASAYEKAVPVGVASNAILDMVGGATYTSANYFNPAKLDRTFVINEDGSFYLNEEATYEPFDAYAVIELEAGTWYWSCESEDVPDIEISCAEFNGITTSPFTITTANTVWFTLRYSEGTHTAPVYFMLSQTENAPFEPYFEGERYAPTTAIKSYGANLFNPQWLIDYVSSAHAGRVEYSDGVLKASGYPIITNITFAKFLELTGLKIGDTFSAKHIVYDENGTIMPNGTYNITFESGGDGTWLDIINQGGKTITITKDMLKYQNLKIYMSNALTSPRYVRNIMLVKGSSQTEYKPYSAEPIDTYIIPSEIQALEGYGKEGFVLDFDNKTATYQGNTTDISAYLTDYATFKSLSVQGGGKLIFENTHKYAVPSTLTYVKRRA